MGCQPRCDVTYIRTVIVVGIEYYYVRYHTTKFGGGAVLVSYNETSLMISFCFTLQYCNQA